MKKIEPLSISTNAFMAKRMITNASCHFFMFGYLQNARISSALLMVKQYASIPRPVSPLIASTRILYIRSSVPNIIMISITFFTHNGVQRMDIARKMLKTRLLYFISNFFLSTLLPDGFRSVYVTHETRQKIGSQRLIP